MDQARSFLSNKGLNLQSLLRVCIGEFVYIFHRYRDMVEIDKLVAKEFAERNKRRIEYLRKYNFHTV